MPTEAQRLRDQAADRRHVTIDTRQISFAGTSEIHGELDLHDALSLESSLARGAAALKDLGSTDSLDARRAAALGQLARGEAALDFTSAGDPKRHVLLHVHLSVDAVHGRGVDKGVSRSALARTEEARALVTAETISEWCGAPDSHITVRPVINLSEHAHSEAVEVPERIRDHVAARDQSCVFPWCTRPARRADCDHILPSGRNGPTCTCNLAALCRTHHRVKTHEHRGRGWSYTALEPGTFLWVSPIGLAFLRTPRGTSDVTRPDWPEPARIVEPPPSDRRTPRP